MTLSLARTPMSLPSDREIVIDLFNLAFASSPDVSMLVRNSSPSKKTASKSPLRGCSQISTHLEDQTVGPHISDDCDTVGPQVAP